MADAIPVNMDPEAQPAPAAKPARKVRVQASPSLDENGVVTQGDYAAGKRDGLGDGSEFGEGESRPVDVPMSFAKIDAKGEQTVEVFTHRAIRTDH